MALALALLIPAISLLLLGDFGLRSSTHAVCGPVDGGPGVVTDKEDYAPGETVIITGCALEAYEGQNLNLTITRPNGVVDAYVVTVSSGAFTFNYLLNGIIGTYTVEVLDGASLLTSTTFTDHDTSTVAINGGDAATHSLSVTLTVTWSGPGGDPTQARFVNVTPSTAGCPANADPAWGPWTATSPPSPDTYPWTLAAGDHGHRKICAQTAHGTLGIPTGTITADDTIWYTVANPPLTEACGLDMVLVIDSSGSINAAELLQMQTAFKDFVAAFLPETPTEMAVVEFDNEGDVIQTFTDVEADLNTAIDSTLSGGNTNWDDALLDARLLFPHRPTKQDLIVFASDGNPNRRGGHTGPLTGHTGGVVTVTEQVAMNFATDESDQAKTDDIRILSLGIGSGLDVVNLKAISGNVEHPPAPVDENVDVITSDFDSLATDLAAFVGAICPGNIVVEKLIDGDGNPGTTGDQTPGVGWTFTTNVDPPDSSSPPSSVTDATGFIDPVFEIDVGGDDTANVDVTETILAGHGFLSTSCAKPGVVGTPAFGAVNDIDVDKFDIVNCTFINVPLGMIEWEKRDESAAGPPHPLQGGATFTVGGANGPFYCLNNLTNPITVVDNGLNDSDPDPGQIKVNDVCPGAYTVTETVAPAGHARDDDTTRSVTVASPTLNQVIGTQGTDEDGNTDESDFHNRLGMLEWEKRNEALSGPPHALQGGATFTVGGASGPFFCTGNATNPVIVVDNSPPDVDPDPGQIKLNNVCLGSYTVTETVAPTGYALDDDVTRAVTVSEADLNNVIGTQGTDEDGNSDESDFHNRLGTLEWEKRKEVGSPPHALQGLATFTVGGASGPFFCTGDATNPVMVVDNSPPDADPDPGQIKLNNVCLGSYTVTETVAPAGYALDDDTTRAVTVSLADLNNVIGTQGTDEDGDTDESDFHNRLGSIEWEKRLETASPPHPLHGGATFTVGGGSGPFSCNGDLTNPVTVVDNGLNDVDPDPGQLKLNNVCLGSYTITETVAPSGSALDDDTTRAVTVSVADLNAVVGTQGTDEDGNTDESDFHNRLGMIEWEKRNEALSGPPHALQVGATFTVGGGSGPFSCNGDATNPVTVVDNGANDADPDPGQFKLNNVCLGTYTVTETVAPTGYALDDDPTRAVTVSVADLNQVIGTQGTDEDGNSDESDFHNRLGMLEWEKRDETGSPPHALQGGATFTVGGASGPFACTGNANNPVIVVDNSPPDTDPDPGQIKLNNVCLGSYTVTETVPPLGFSIDDDPTRAVTVSDADLNAVIGAQGTDEDGNTDESDFHDFVVPPATLTIIKDAVPNDPTDFDFNCGSLGTFMLDDDADVTLIRVKTFNPPSGNYTCTEVAEPGWQTTVACSDPDNGTTTSGATANIDLDANETVTCTFTNTFQPTPPPPPVGGIAGVMDSPESPQSVESAAENGSSAWPLVLVVTGILSVAGVIYVARRRRTG